ncbi:MAG: tyrosine-type recombinase/integrase [Bacteroidetes bacterium]|nr:tyrosine-type recombinase/integrase [Bacteroidota bacterium]
MKRLPIASPPYQLIERSFKEWLDVLGYASQSVYQMPLAVRGLLHYMENMNKTQLQDITADIIKDYYYNHLKTRKNYLHGAGGLSNVHLNKHLQALKKFTEYLMQTGKLQIPVLSMKWETVTDDKLTILTEEEIQQLFKITEQPHERKKQSKSEEVYEAIQQRDRAMLTIFYGCGLRRNEGVHLDITDINLDRELLHVRKGKGYKERFVPISSKGVKFLEDYIYNGRPILIKDNREDALFINANNGKRLGGQLMLVKLQQLIRQTGNTELMQKEVGLHTLRHSIATHLLAHGMKLEKIKDFLGHSSLESTQIYTHLINEEDGEVY